MIIVDHSYTAQFFCFFNKGIYFVGVINNQSHFEKLIFSSVFLRAYIRNIEVVFTYKFEYRSNTAGNIFQTKFEQYHTAGIIVTLQITYSGEFFCCFSKLLSSSFRINEKHMRVDRFIIAYSCNIHTKRSKALAGF